MRTADKDVKKKKKKELKKKELDDSLLGPEH